MTMSDDAEAGWAELVQRYREQGYQNYAKWSVSFAASEAAVVRELQAYDLIEPFTPGNWHLTLTGLLSILEVRDMSPEAKEKLDAMGIEWRSTGLLAEYAFGVGDQQAIFNELEARGFVEPSPQGAIQLTDYGKQWLLARRSDAF
jgi:hypothetical protein